MRYLLSFFIVLVLALSACASEGPVPGEQVVPTDTAPAEPPVGTGGYAPPPEGQEVPIGERPPDDGQAGSGGTGEGSSGDAGGITPTEGTGSATTKEFAITAKQWSFDPATITVQQGDRVRLEITSADVTHGFSIPEYSINKQIIPGETATIEFTADKAGTFTFRCNIYCGSGHGGMKGTLVVE